MQRAQPQHAKGHPLGSTRNARMATPPLRPERAPTRRRPPFQGVAIETQLCSNERERQRGEL